MKGKITDENGAPLAFANVLLLKASDSTLVKGELTADDGTWVMEGPFNGIYFIRTSLLGYNDQSGENFTLKSGETLELQVSQLESASIELETVEVKARKPFLEQKAGMLVVNVEQSITGQGGNLMDILKKAPGLIVMNGQIRLAGRSGVAILIDGKPTRYMDIHSLLREMPADNIARIEIISQPDASYDADGTGGVINIILKKNAMLGTSGTVQAGAGYGKLPKYRGGILLNHGSGPWRFSLNTGYSYRTNHEELHLDRIVGDTRFVQANLKPSKPQSAYIRTSVDWSPSQRHLFGLAAGLTAVQNNRTAVNTTGIGPVDSAAYLTLETTNQLTRDVRHASLSGTYSFKIDTSGQLLESDISWTRYNRGGGSLANTFVTMGEATPFPAWRNEEPSNTHIFASRLDYTLPLTRNLKIKSGLKFSYAEIDNDLKSWSETGGDWVENPFQTNHFVYTERTGAAYITTSYSSDKLELNAGLRYEDNYADGKSLTLDSTNTRHLKQLFPNFNLAYAMGKHFGLSGAYSYRIERPSYQSLNPFIYYYDPYTYERGNSNLRPELTHSAKLSLTYDKQPFINFEYTRTKDIITLVTEQDDATGAAYAATVNLDYLERYGGSVFFPMSFVKGMSGYSGIMLFYNRYSSDYLGGDFDRDQLSLTLYLQMNYKFNDSWSAELSGWYQGKGLEGLMAYKPFYAMSLGVQKKMMNDRANLRVSFDDFIYRVWNGELDYQNMQMDIRNVWETSIVQATFTYKFGSRFLAKEKKREGSAEEETQRANRKE